MNQVALSIEDKYKQYLGSRSHSTNTPVIQEGIMGHNEQLFNRYVLSDGRKSLAVAFRSFTVYELPAAFRNCVIGSASNRSMIATLEQLGTGPMLSAVMNYLNDMLRNEFANGSMLFYAFQTKIDNVHMFYYAERDSDRKVVVQLQL